MAVTVGELLVKISADTAELRSGFQKAEASLKGFEKMAKSLGAVLGGGYLAAQAKQMGDALFQAASQAEAEMARVEATVKAAGASWEALRPQIEAYSKAVIRLGFDDEATATSVAKLLNATHDYTEALRLNQLAMDLARYKGIDLDTATTALIRTWSGNTRMLKEFGIEVDEHASRMEILNELTAKVSGQSEAFANTSVGKLQEVQIQWQNIQETVGDRLLPAMDRLADTTSEVLNWFDNLSPETQQIIGGFTGVGVAAGVLTPAIIALNAAAAALGTTLGVLALGLGGLAVAGIVAVGVSELATAHQHAAEAQGRELESTQQLLDRYKELSSKTALTADEKAELSRASSELVDKFPDLVRGFDSERGAIIDVAEAYHQLALMLDEHKKKALEAAQARLTSAKNSQNAYRQEIDETTKFVQQFQQALNSTKGFDWSKIKALLNQAPEDLKLTWDSRYFGDEAATKGWFNATQKHLADLVSAYGVAAKKIGESQSEIDGLLGKKPSTTTNTGSSSATESKDTPLQWGPGEVVLLQRSQEQQKIYDKMVQDAADEETRLTSVVVNAEKDRWTAIQAVLDQATVDQQYRVDERFRLMTDYYQADADALAESERQKQVAQDALDVEAESKQLARAQAQQAQLDANAAEQEARIREKYALMTAYYQADADAFMLAEEAKRVAAEQGDVDAIAAQVRRWEAVQAVFDNNKDLWAKMDESTREGVAGIVANTISGLSGSGDALTNALEGIRQIYVQKLSVMLAEATTFKAAMDAILNPMNLITLGIGLLLGGIGDSRAAAEEQKRQAEEAQRKWEEAVQRISDTMKSAFSTKTYGDFLKQFGDNLRGTVIDGLSKAFMESAMMKPLMEQLTGVIQQATADGFLSPGEIAAMQELYRQAAQAGSQFYNQLQGINFNVPGSGGGLGGVVNQAPQTTPVVQQVSITIEHKALTDEEATKTAKVIKAKLADLALGTA